MTQPQIQRIVQPDDPLVQKIYDLFASQFGKEELDPIDVVREELENTAKGEHEAPYIMLATSVDGEVVNALAGNYFRLSTPRVAGAAIGYAATTPDLRLKGLGKAIVGEFLKQVDQYCSEEDRRLLATVLEAQTPSAENPNFYDSRPFWARLGWKLSEGGIHCQPSMEFVKKTGLPKNEPIPLTFMVKPGEEQSQEKIYAPALRDLVNVMFDNWYIPDREDFRSNKAYEVACGHVAGVKWELFNSLAVQPDGNVRLLPYEAKK